MPSPLYRQARFFKLWQSDPKAALDEFIREITLKGYFEPDVFEADRGEIVLKEGDRTRHLFVLLEGSVSLFKAEVTGSSIPVTEIDPGGMFGVLSFFSNKEAITTAVVSRPARILRLDRNQVEQILSNDVTLSIMGRQMLTANLMERYRQVVDLNLELKRLNTDLDLEKSRLAEALRELKSAHQRLIHQEKMATLGQLVAGVAHEINNPAAALENAVQYLSQMLPDLFLRDSGGDSAQMTDFFMWGLGSSSSGIADREKELSLRKEFDRLKSSECRQIGLLDSDHLEVVRSIYSRGDLESLRKGLDYMEAGMHLRRIRITSGRIAALVKSLKRYSRQDVEQIEPVDIREGIVDTLQVLAPRLRNIELELIVPDDLPRPVADAAELNQVWTNILVNACDALGGTGKIEIWAGVEDDRVQVAISDNGPGVPPEIRDKIFKPNFTTRNSSGNFGLGLGLSISRELIMKNGGDIEVGDAELGGALFLVQLPVPVS